MKIYIIVIAIVLGFGIAHADIVTTGTQVTATMDEPTMNVENSGGVVTPLTDLKETWVTYEIQDAVLGGVGEVVCGERIPATSLLGGGKASTSCVIPIPANSETDVTFLGYAVDISGNRSDPTPEVIKRFDSLRSEAPTF